jgi:hypothetical protein
MNTQTPFLFGAIVLAWIVAGLVFLRFHRRTRDRFFLYFVASFWLEAIDNFCAAVGLRPFGPDTVYMIRIVAYVLILVAIFDKNLPRRER